MIFFIGYFQNEAKTRFRCKIRINNELQDCYVPCSCKLSKIYNIKNNSKVLLTTNKDSKKNLKYALVAIFEINKFIIINPSYSNIAYKNFLISKKIDFVSEYKFENYRADFFIKSNNEIIEIKSILSNETQIIFPQVNSNRFANQLKAIYNLLNQNYKCKLILSILNPDIREIKLDKNTSIYPLLISCLNKGLNIECMYCFLNKKNELFMKKININLLYE